MVFKATRFTITLCWLSAYYNIQFYSQDCGGQG